MLTMRNGRRQCLLSPLAHPMAKECVLTNGCRERLTTARRISDECPYVSPDVLLCLLPDGRSKRNIESILRLHRASEVPGSLMRGQQETQWTFRGPVTAEDLPVKLRS